MSRIVPLAKPAYASSGRERARQHGDGHGEDRRRQDRQRADDDRDDRAGEEAKSRHA